MSFKILFAPSASFDLKEAKDYYQQISEKLSDKFSQAINERIERLKITPLAGAIRFDEIRCTKPRKFPYLIYYEVKFASGEIVILRVLHGRQKPLWQRT